MTDTVTDPTVTYPSDAGTEIYLLTVRGAAKATSLADAKELHNATAGAPPSVAGARAFGDLSHNVFVPAESNALSLLFIDTWNSPTGVGQFFANPQVQAGADLLFSERDATLWAPAPDSGSYTLPAPSGRAVTGVGYLRAPIVSVDAARAAFKTHAGAGINRARLLGQVAHQTWLRAPMPGATTPLEILGIDYWIDVQGMLAYYSDLSEFTHLAPAFAGPPDTGTWKAAGSDWVEW
jgi:hypothetical protein